MRKANILIKVILITIVISGCSGNTGTKKSNTCRITIFAAAGTRKVTEDVCDFFEKKSLCRVERNYASSGTLARQIANGAVADVFISANKQWIDFLVTEGAVQEHSVYQIASNSLVVIAPVNVETKVPHFTKQFDILSAIPDKIAIGDPTYVPVGKYTKMVFDSLGWFENIKEKIIMGKDVTSVLRYVELGECDWGVVYYSEAIQSVKVKVITKIPESLHTPIIFFVADIKSQKAKGHELSTMLKDTISQPLFVKYGFQPVKPM